ncbi:MAG: polysaccharide deacetylase family protein [Vicinamibacteria bacterium]
MKASFGPRERKRARLRRAAASLVSIGSPGAGAPAIRILTYHRVNDLHPEDRLTVTTPAFTDQMEYLARTERVVSLGEAFASVQDARRPPGNAVALTFDDGYLDNFECALPILERFRLKAAFFVVTGLVGTTTVIERYRGCCESDACMDWGHVQKLLARGHEVGGHGRTHRELAPLDDSELEIEIDGCAHDLRRETGRSPNFFCYPRGSENVEVRRRVASSGFAAALTVYPGPNFAGCDPYALRRTEISGEDEMEDFRMKLQGRYDNLHRLIQGISRWA